jgi:hypothetical protein
VFGLAVHFEEVEGAAAFSTFAWSQAFSVTAPGVWSGPGQPG